MPGVRENQKDSYWVSANDFFNFLSVSDSGGPLFTNNPYTLVGVVSWGKGCAVAGYPVYFSYYDLLRTLNLIRF